MKNSTMLRGLTLIELLISLAVLSALVSISLAGWHSKIFSHQLNSQANTILRILNYTRTQAISLQRTVSVCPSRDKIHCSQNWMVPWMVFIDSNFNHTRDQWEQVLVVDNEMIGNCNINWRSFRQRDIIQFFSSGQTTDNGSFRLCESKAEEKRIVLARSGRSRVRTLLK